MSGTDSSGRGGAPDTGAGPFRRRTLVVLAAVGGTGLALFLLYMLFGPRAASHAPLPRSAVGYRALVGLLEADLEVRPARGFLPPGASPSRGVLVLDPHQEQLAQLAETVERAAAQGVPVVLVLPKWRALADPVRPGWAGSVELVPVGVAAAALGVAMGYEGTDREGGGDALEDGAPPADLPAAAPSPDRPAAGGEGSGGRRSISRDPGPGGPPEAAGEGGEGGEGDGAGTGGAWTGIGLPFEVVRPETAGPFTGPGEGSGSLEPDLPRPQLLRDRADLLVPWVASPQGILVARARDLPLWVVADPDLVNVAGLALGDNGVIAHRLLVEELGVTAWYVREGSFGALPPERSVWSGLLRPPLSVVTLHLALVALLVSWVAAERFGRPRLPPPRVPPGKRTLVDNTARLLERAGDPREALQRYLDLTVRRAAERLGLPPGLEERERLHRLDRIGRRRGATRRLRDQVVAVESLRERGAARHRRALQVAADLHRWYREVCEAPDGGDGR